WLGYVWPDGNTDVPQVRVSPAIFDAAKKLRDGELTPEPVPEGANWAVIWRRETRKATAESLAHASSKIRQRLALSKARVAHEELLRGLRAQHLTDYQPAHAEAFSPPTSAPTTASPEVRHPPIVSQPAARSPVPRETDLGDR